VVIAAMETITAALTGKRENMSHAPSELNTARRKTSPAINHQESRGAEDILIIKR